MRCWRQFAAGPNNEATLAALTGRILDHHRQQRLLFRVIGILFARCIATAAAETTKVGDEA